MKKTDNIDNLSFGLSKILGKKFDYLKINRIDEGFSEKSYKLIVSSGNQIESYFLKEIENESEYLFYKEIVYVIGIHTPRIYGALPLDSRTYMLMEYIESFKTKWNDKQRYLKAIDLLIEKDLLVQNNWEKINQSHFVNKKVSYNMIIRDISRINEGEKMKIHISYDELSEFLGRNKSRMKYIRNILSIRGMLTLCHNDFHLNNVILSKTNNKVYLIDWKNPNIGSVFIDLAKIVNNAPQKFQQELLEYYKIKVKTIDFEYLYPIAEAYDHLGVLSWAVKAVKAQKTKVLKYVDYNYKCKRIIKVISNLS